VSASLQSLPPGLAPLLRGLAKIVPWAFEHPLLIRRRWWLTAALALVGLEVLSILFVGGIVAFVPLVPLAVVLGGVAGLRKIARRRDKPLVLLCRFDSPTAAAFDASLNHLEALRDRLRAHPEFEREIELRVLKASGEELMNLTCMARGIVRALCGIRSWSSRRSRVKGGAISSASPSYSRS
jgi:hypothetical protein